MPIGFEARCKECGETFNPADEHDLSHLREDGSACGVGELVGEWRGLNVAEVADAFEAQRQRLAPEHQVRVYVTGSFYEGPVLCGHDHRLPTAPADCRERLVAGLVERGLKVTE